MTELGIRKVIAVPGQGGFYFDDQTAVLSGRVRKDGFIYEGVPLTSGYEQVRQVADVTSVLLILEDGQVAMGDCASVQYSGVGGRDPLMSGPAMARGLTDFVAPRLEGHRLRSFRESAELVDTLTFGQEKLGAAAAYGLTQALLHAVALSRRCTMAEVIQEEWDLTFPLAKIPVYAQSGDARQINVDKMILRGADAIPHGLINEPALVGSDGQVFLDYVAWVRNRVTALRKSADYQPVLHFDVYGLLGRVFGIGSDALTEYLLEVEEAAAPFRVRIEHPLDAGDRDNQIAELASLRKSLRARGSQLQLVADELANTLEDIKAFVAAGAIDMMQIKTPDLGALQHSVEAVLACKQAGVAAHVGGSCTETEIAAKASVHLALACGADQLLAKPGMGVDEGFSLVVNEMNRTLALTAAGGTDAR